MQGVLAVVLAGGAGERLSALSAIRSKPAVPFGGKYRLIDIPISNCLNAGLRHMFVLTQFNSASLHRHISLSYKFDHFSGGFVEILAADWGVVRHAHEGRRTGKTVWFSVKLDLV